MIYLDNAATTLYKPATVTRAVRDAMRDCGGAGRGGHSAAVRAAEVIYSTRETAANYFHMRDPERVIFTCSGTHSLNIAIKALTVPGGRVIISGFEHNAVVRPLYRLSQEIGVKVDILPTPLFEPEMAVHLFEMAMASDVCLVVCTHVSNVFGYVLPIERIWHLCRARGIPMIVDAAQSAGSLPIDGDSGPYFCMPGHKGLYGPQGTGLLLCPQDGQKLTPLMEGGTGTASMEAAMPTFYPERLEAGTPNAPGIAGLGAGLRFVAQYDNLPQERLLKKLYTSLSSIWSVRCYAAENLFCQQGAISFTIKNRDSEEVAARLAEHGIAVRGGLHCSPSAHKTAGTHPGGTIRASIGAFTTSWDLRRLTSALRRI